MQFAYSAELRPGLRIAKPIYNKDGVLLCKQNSRLTLPAINSIQSSDLSGIYILEPAESAPMLTPEDIAFEQAQTIYLFKLKDIFEKIYKRQPIGQLDSIVEDVLKRYGHIRHRVNFNQNLRTSHDFMYKHATSVAILSTLIGQHIDIPEDDFKALIAASILYCFGYRFMANNAMDKQSALEKGTAYLSMITDRLSYLPKALRIVEYFILSNNPERTVQPPSEDIILLSEILKVSVEFDLLTSIAKGQEPQSELLAINAMKARSTDFNDRIVNIMAHCLCLIPSGSTVTLNNNEKALVLEENSQDYMHPIVFRLHDKSLCNLYDSSIGTKLYITDLVKTEDNRIEINQKSLDAYNERKNTQS